MVPSEDDGYQLSIIENRTGFKGLFLILFKNEEQKERWQGE